MRTVSVGSPATRCELLIVIDPAGVVRIGRSTTSHEKRADLGCGRRGYRIAGGIHAAVRIGAVREEQFDQLALAGTGRGVQCATLGAVGSPQFGSAPRSRSRRAISS